MLSIKSNKDIWITRGDNAFIDLEVRQPNFPYDTYCLEEEDSVLLTIRKNKFDNIDGDNPVLLQKELIEGRFIFTSSDLKEFEFGDYFYDVQLKFGNGVINTIIGPNIFKVLPEVTY